MDGATMFPEFDHEFAETRKALERVPDDKLDWKPHEKSYSLGQLASHLAEIPNWMGSTVQTELLDLDEMDYEPFEASTREELLAAFDRSVAEARKILSEASGETLMESWSMKYGGEITMTMPKAAVVRSFIMSHNIHHRAQLGVYLRLLGVPVPGHYGPSADEKEALAEEMRAGA